MRGAVIDPPISGCRLAEDRQEDLVVLIRATRVVDECDEERARDCQGAMPESSGVGGGGGIWIPCKNLRHRNDRENFDVPDRGGRAFPEQAPKFVITTLHDSSVKLK